MIDFSVQILLNSTRMLLLVFFWFRTDFYFPDLFAVIARYLNVYLKLTFAIRPIKL